MRLFIEYLVPVVFLAGIAASEDAAQQQPQTSLETFVAKPETADLAVPNSRALVPVEETTYLKHLYQVTVSSIRQQLVPRGRRRRGPRGTPQQGPRIGGGRPPGLIPGWATTRWPWLEYVSGGMYLVVPAHILMAVHVISTLRFSVASVWGNVLFLVVPFLISTVVALCFERLNPGSHIIRMALQRRLRRYDLEISGFFGVVSHRNVVVVVKAGDVVVARAKIATLRVDALAGILKQAAWQRCRQFAGEHVLANAVVKVVVAVARLCQVLLGYLPFIGMVFSGGPGPGPGRRGMGRTRFRGRRGRGESNEVVVEGLEIVIEDLEGARKRLREARAKAQHGSEGEPKAEGELKGQPKGKEGESSEKKKALLLLLGTANVKLKITDFKLQLPAVCQSEETLGFDRRQFEQLESLELMNRLVDYEKLFEKLTGAARAKAELSFREKAELDRRIKEFLANGKFDLSELVAMFRERADEEQTEESLLDADGPKEKPKEKRDCYIRSVVEVKTVQVTNINDSRVGVKVEVADASVTSSLLPDAPKHGFIGQLAWNKKKLMSFKQPVLETLRLDVACKAGQLRDCKVDIVLNNANVPVHLVSMYRGAWAACAAQPGSGETVPPTSPGSERPERPGTPETLLSRFKSFDLKIANLAFNYKFHSAREPFAQSLVLSVDNLLVSFKNIEKYQHAQYENSSKAVSHELIANLAGWKVKILDSTVAFVPLATASVRSNVRQLLELAQPGDRELVSYKFLADIAISNPQVSVTPYDLSVVQSLLGKTGPPAAKQPVLLAHAKHAVPYLPLVDVKVSVNGPCVQVSDLNNHSASTKLVAECEKIYWAVNTVRPKDHCNGLYSQSHRPNNDLIEISPDVRGLLDDSLEEFYHEFNNHNKSFKAVLQVSNLMVKSFEQGAPSEGLVYFPVFHFSQFDTALTVDVVKQSPEVTVAVQTTFENAVLNITKKSLVLAIGQLADRLRKFESRSGSSSSGLRYRLEGLAVSYTASFVSRGVLVSFGARRMLPDQTVAPGVNLADGLRGMQLRLGDAQVELSGSALGVAGGSAQLNKLALYTICEFNQQQIDQKPLAQELLQLPLVTVEHADGACTVKVDKVLATVNVTSVWIGFVVAYLFSYCRRLVRGKHLAAKSGSHAVPAVQVNYIAVHLDLPENVFLLLTLNRVRLEQPRLSVANIRLYTRMQTGQTTGKQLFCMLNINELANDVSGLVFHADELRFSLPFRFFLYKITDSLITMFKAVKQIALNFYTVAQHGRNAPLKVIVPEAEGAKHVPRIELVTKKFSLDLKDSAFETDLALIYRMGLIEQRERLEKLALFNERALEDAFGLQHQSADKPVTSSPKQDFRSTFRRNTDQGPARRTGLGPTRRTNTSPLFGMLHSGSFHSGFRKRASTSPSLAQGVLEAGATWKEKKDLLDHLDRVLYNSTGQLHDALAAKRVKLDQHFAKSWYYRHQRALKIRQFSIRHKNKVVLGENFVDAITNSTYDVVEFSSRPSLVSLFSKNFQLILEPPRLGKQTVADFLYDIGKGMPKTSEYSLLIPVYMTVNCDSLTLLLRDYYLPLLHLPAGDNRPISIAGNITFAERLNADPVSRRTVFVPFLPGALLLAAPFYGCHVLRSLDPVKFFHDITVVSRARTLAIISWGKSFQPSISTAMLCFDNVSKPPLDSSPPIGWWDKIRLIVHGKVHFAFAGKLNLFIKGLTDPYKLIDDGSGFVFSWNNGVTLDINKHGDGQRLVTVKAKQFVYGIPQLSENLRRYWKFRAKECNLIYLESDRFRKVVVNLMGDIEWVLGMTFEKEADNSAGLHPGDTPRTSQFRPHYEVHRVNPQALAPLEAAGHDSYRGFRSNYIHLAIGFNNNNSNSDCLMNETYNSFHLSPHLTLYFMRWWSLFNNSLGLPLRKGRLFKLEEINDYTKHEVKFGQALHTIKYQIQLSPMFIAHFFRRSSIDNQGKKNEVQFTGLKMKTDMFVLDLHQRKQKVREENPILRSCKESWHLKFNQGKIDCLKSTGKLINTAFSEESIEDLLLQSLEFDSDASSTASHGSDSDALIVIHPDLSQARDGKSNCSDVNHNWVDIDDYIELNYARPVSAKPKVELMLLFSSPRFTYIRQNDRDVVQQQYPFGHEHSHLCFYGRVKSQEQTRIELAQARWHQIHLALTRAAADDASVPTLRNSLQTMAMVIKEQKEFLRAMEHYESPSSDSLNLARTKTSESIISSTHESFTRLRETSSLESLSKFSNRFIVHDLLLKWNNKLRNHFLKYLNEVNDIRSYKYFMTRGIITYLENLRHASGNPASAASAKCASAGTLNFTSEEYLENFDQELVQKQSDQELEYSYLVKLVNPQIQLQSSQKKLAVALLLAEEIELKIYDLVEGTPELLEDEPDARPGDDVSKLIESRYGLFLKNMQVFVLDHSQVPGYTISFHEKSFGSETGQWPPWINAEGFYDSSSIEPLSIVEKTSCSLRYDKLNNLYKLHNQKKRNLLRVDTASLVFISDSLQFESIYYIALDLLFSKDLKSSQRSVKLKQLVLASDLEAIEQLDKYVETIQNQIRALMFTRNHLLLCDALAGADSKEQRVYLDLWLRRLKLKLLYSIRALREGTSAGEDKFEIKWDIFSDQVIWKFLDKARTLFLDLVFTKNRYSGIGSPDGSVVNSVNIRDIQGFNGVGSYADFIKPLEQLAHDMVTIHWKELSPIGGIPIMEYVNIHFEPLELQIESSNAKRLFDYVFPKRDEPEPATRKQRPDDAVDDFKLMEERSLKFVSFNKVEISKISLNLSYKANRPLSLANVDQLVVKIPPLAYLNYICSLQDLALSVKKDLIKVLIHHTGEIIGNKFKHHKKHEPIVNHGDLEYANSKDTERNTRQNRRVVEEIAEEEDSFIDDQDSEIVDLQE